LQTPIFTCSCAAKILITLALCLCFFVVSPIFYYLGNKSPPSASHDANDIKLYHA
jgi:flagellar biosynthesis protein FliP